MFYVFHVEVGRLINFDMSVACASIQNLKQTIERLQGIPAQDIVLLGTGGEIFNDNCQVSCFCAGTDTNPLFMFVKGAFQLPPQKAYEDFESIITENVKHCVDLAHSQESVIKRTKIAAYIYERAKDEERIGECLIHEQHLQQQGWSTVVANLEDLSAEFHLRFKRFCEVFDKHFEKRIMFMELLQNFSDDLGKLSNIPILPGLMPLAENFHGFDNFLENDDAASSSAAEVAATVGNNDARSADNAEDKTVTTSTSTSPNKKLKMANDSHDSHHSQTHSINLLQWLSSKENHNFLLNMSTECYQSLSTFDENVYEELKLEIQKGIQSAEQNVGKEIRGLEERLCKLEEIMARIRIRVKDQKELSACLHQTQIKCSNLRDTSILPDLCASHQSQLEVMLDNYIKIRDNRIFLTKGKDELVDIIYNRLQRVVYVENAMSEFDNKLLFYYQCMKRTEQHILIIEQIHHASYLYVDAVTEVVRRKIFSSEFHSWITKIAREFNSLRREEIKRRQQFNNIFTGHFLNTLFPGMADMPPDFVNENSLIFDDSLPNITRSDVDILAKHFPEIVNKIQSPEVDSIIYFFLTHSGAHQRERLEEFAKGIQKRAPETLENEQTVDMVVSGKMPLNPRVSELRKEVSGLSAGTGDESETETDTENEFEQVPPTSQQSVATSTTANLLEVSTDSKSTCTEQVMTKSAETLTEQNAEALKIERVKLEDMCKIALECLHFTRNDLEAFREEAEKQKQNFQSDLQLLKHNWNTLRIQYEASEQEFNMQQTEKDQIILQLQEELEKCNMQLNEEKQMNMEMSSMKIKLATLEAQLDELKEKLDRVNEEKDLAVMEAREKLIHEHKTEIESLRQRFKLMTSTERSPSDLSLDSNPLSDNIIEKHVHDTLIDQLRSEMEMEKAKAITAAIEIERCIWQSNLIPENVSILKGIIEKRERQLEELREKDLMLTEENIKLKMRINTLVDENTNKWLNEKISYLNKDKWLLEEQLKHEKSKRIEMESSFAALKFSTYEGRSKFSGYSQSLIVLEACTQGDLVLVVWNINRGQFMVVQDSEILYFVHAECLPALNLYAPSDNTTIPTPYYVIGRVTEKQFCIARKDENRYRVNKGDRFYRVRLAPFTSRQTLRRKRLESCESHSEASPSSSTANVVTSDVSGTSPLQSAPITTSAGIGILPKDLVDAATNTAIPLATSPIKIISTTANNSTAAAASSAPSSSSVISMLASGISVVDEPVSPLSERCRYTSVSEEDEDLLAAAVSTTTLSGGEEVASLASANQNKNFQPTVITEQPTATASKMELDLLLASAKVKHSTSTASIKNLTSATASNIQDDLITTSTETITTAVESNVIPQIVLSTSPPTLNIPSSSSSSSAAIFIPTTHNINTSTTINSPSIPTAIGATSEDSLEYKSFDPDFPMPE